MHWGMRTSFTQNTLCFEAAILKQCENYNTRQKSDDNYVERNAGANRNEFSAPPAVTPQQWLCLG